MRYLKSFEDKGIEGWCTVQDRKFVISKHKGRSETILLLATKLIKLRQEKLPKNGNCIFTVQKSHEPPVILSVDTEDVFISLLGILWAQGAQIEGEEGTIAYKAAKKLREAEKRKSITAINEPGPTMKQPFSRDERTRSDGEQNLIKPRKLTRPPTKPNASFDKSAHRTPGSVKPGGSRMSAFFRSLPRRNRKKYDFSADVVDGLPKSQLSGPIYQIQLDENGEETSTRRQGKVSGKIFYAYDVENEVKPIFKVPLRNSHVEDVMEPEQGIFSFQVSPMEKETAFKFTVDTEEEFEKWFSALYLVDSRANQSGLSSRESLLDESRNEADTETRPDRPSEPFSGSNSSNSLSSMLSKQAKSLGGSGDELKSPRKVSEEVFHGSLESIRHSGYLYEVNITEKNDVKSRTKIRRWCVLRKSWIEIYDNKSDKIPVRGIAIGHHSLELVGVDDSGEKFTMCLRSEDDDYLLCATNEEDYSKWMFELKKVCKKRGRRTSDAAKLALRSASDGIRTLLSSSSLSGSGKRDSKRATIVLNEDDEKVVEKFTDTVESGSKISGILLIIMKDGKLTKPKKRLCTIRDGTFCIAKRSKPTKYIKTIELLNVAILDECDVDKRLFRFRLDYGDDLSMTFQTVDHETAENWMVGISMAILLERLTSRDKFPQQGEEELSHLGGNSEVGPETNDLGLIDVSPMLPRNGRASSGSNLSSDIKQELDRKISYGSNYLHPLSNLLESAFDVSLSQYAGSSASSSREGTLERDRGSGLFVNSRKNSDGVIIEEALEDFDTIDGKMYSAAALADQQQQPPAKQSNGETESTADLLIKITTCDSGGEGEPATGSVSSTVAKFEQLSSYDENVFEHENYQPDHFELEKELAELLKERESLEKERNVSLDRIPDLQKVVKETKDRRASSSSSSQYKNEYDITRTDLNNMEQRLEVVSKRLHIVEGLIKKKVSRIPESFRARGTVISPHVIV